MSEIKEELKRKAFHLLGLMYVALLLKMDAAQASRLLAVIFIGLAAAEFLRLKNPAVRTFNQKLFGSIMRAEEANRLSGVFWMSLGALASSLLLQKRPALAGTAMLYLILGDAAASLVGKSVQGPRWPGFPKTISGSLACFLVCLGVGFLTLYPRYGVDGIVVSALVATIVEIPPSRVNDNFLIPLMTSVFFLLWFGRA